MRRPRASVRCSRCRRASPSRSSGSGRSGCSCPRLPAYPRPAARRDRAAHRRRGRLRAARAARRADLHAHAPHDRPAGERGCVWLGWALVPQLLMGYGTWAFYFGHAMELLGIVADRHPGRARPAPGRLLTPARRRPRRHRAGRRRGVVPRPARALADGRPRREGPLDRGARPPRGDARLRGRRGAAPAARDLRHLAIGGLLHDMGKLRVPRGDPLQADRARPRRVRGRSSGTPGRRPRLADLVGFPPEVLALVLDHHERLDGGGYPRGLAARGRPRDARARRSATSTTRSSRTASTDPAWTPGGGRSDCSTRRPARRSTPTASSRSNACSPGPRATRAGSPGSRSKLRRRALAPGGSSAWGSASAKGRAGMPNTSSQRQDPRERARWLVVRASASPRRARAPAAPGRRQRPRPGAGARATGCATRRAACC